MNGMTPHIGAVCFDVGGTLLHMDPPPEVIFAGICQELGADVTPEQAFAAYERAEPWFTAHKDLYRASLEAFWLRGNRILLEALDITEELDRRAAVITVEFPKRQWDWKLYPEVPETLAALCRRGLPLAVVSNWDPGLTHVLERRGLRGAFTVVIASADVGVAKPDPRIFQQAVQGLGVAPGEALHVGDLYDYDVVGARAAGLVPVLVDRRGRDAHRVAQRVAIAVATDRATDDRLDYLRIVDLRGLLPIIDGNSQNAWVPF